MMLWGMVMASIAVYFSGSRSAGYLLLAVLFIPALLIKGRSHWLSLMILPLTMLTIYVGTVWLALPFFPVNEGWREIALLGERFAAAPSYLVGYALMYMDINLSIPDEVAQSIEGRFVGSGRDAGWLVLYQDVGLPGKLTLLALSSESLWLAVRAYYAKRDLANVYVLVILCCCLLTGLVMRFQIFPVWLFVGIFLVPCLKIWARAISTNSNDGGQKCAF